MVATTTMATKQPGDAPAMRLAQGRPSRRQWTVDVDDVILALRRRQQKLRRKLTGDEVLAELFLLRDCPALERAYHDVTDKGWRR